MRGWVRGLTYYSVFGKSGAELRWSASGVCTGQLSSAQINELAQTGSATSPVNESRGWEMSLAICGVPVRARLGLNMMLGYCSELKVEPRGSNVGPGPAWDGTIHGARDQLDYRVSLVSRSLPASLDSHGLACPY